MRAIKSRDTLPEREVRAALRVIAPGYRLHKRGLPGRPDIVYGARKIAVFVHGCFWHGHDCAHGSRVPKTTREFWTEKIARNRARDARDLAALASLGWRVLVLWECGLRDGPSTRARLRAFLGPPPVLRRYERAGLSPAPRRLSDRRDAASK